MGKIFVRTCGNSSTSAWRESDGSFLGKNVSVDVYKDDENDQGDRFLRVQHSKIKFEDRLLTQHEREELFDRNELSELDYAFGLMGLEHSF